MMHWQAIKINQPTSELQLFGIQSFPFSWLVALHKSKESSLHDYFIHSSRENEWFHTFPRSLTWNKTQTTLSRIWTRITDSFSYEDERYAKRAFNLLMYSDFYHHLDCYCHYISAVVLLVKMYLVYLVVVSVTGLGVEVRKKTED